MKKTNGLRIGLAVLALSSTLLVFTGCKKKTTVTQKPVDDDIKYDANLKMRYKVFNGEAEIVEIEKQGEELIIPGEIGGAKVTRMSCTYTDEELRRVTIPASLTYLTGNGFMKCENLSSVTFESGATIADIPSKAFIGTKLSTITIPASVRSISYEAFQDVDTLTNVTFESGSKLETIGPFAFYSCDGLTSINLPSNLTTVGASAFEKCANVSTLSFSSATKLSSIDDYAFSGCSSLTTLDFTSNTILTKIGANAFRGCTELTSVTFDSALKGIGSKAFYNTQKIRTLVLPENLISVGDEAFVNAGIEELELKSGSDTTFGMNAFSQYLLVGERLVPEEKITKLTVNGNLSLDKIFTEYAKQVRLSLSELHVTGERIAPQSYKGCINLVDLTIDPTIIVIGESAFEDCSLITTVTLNEGLKEIAINTFKNCVKLQNITLPSTVTTVRNGAFDGCVKVANLDLSNLTLIGAYAFRNTKIATPTFSNKLQTIGDYAFDSCENIESVEIDTLANGGSTTIRQYAFNNCKNIITVNLSSNVVLESNAFAQDTNVETLVVRGEYGLDTLFGESKEEAAKKIKYITIAENTETIENGAFAGCLLVTQIDIPDTVKKIGDEAFRGCRGITTLVLPDTLEKIGKYAFAECDKLVLTELPENIVEISEGLFALDFSITNFTLNANTTKIGANAFKGCSNVEIASLNDSITYIGNNAFEECLKLELSALPTELKELGKNAFSGCLLVDISETNDKLTKIGEYAFKGCQAITSFEFANDLVENDGLGYAILEGCTKVEELKIYGTTSLETLFGSSVTALKPVLSKITIKEGSTSLADNMFKGFTAISEVTFESVITEIGVSAFEGCISLTGIDISEVQFIGDRAFAESGLNAIEIPSNGIILGTSVFSGCSSLSELTFAAPSTDESLNITEIPDGSFSGTILVDVILPDTVTSIGLEAFSNILTLNNFTISDSSELTTISEAAFYGCSNILNFYIPSKVSLIGEQAFAECTALRKVEFDTNNKIESISFRTFTDCYALTIINLPNSIRGIGDYAFENCTCLVDLHLPETLESLGNYVFSGCQSLNDVLIPEKVEIIPLGTFKDCYMLENVTWNSNIKMIGEEAFYNTPFKTALPNTLYEIGKKAFASDDKKPVTFVGVDLVLGVNSDGVSLIIGDEAFLRSGVNSVKLGAKITDMGVSVFASSALTSVDFNELKITKIGEYMFDQCTVLTTVSMDSNTTINTIGEGAFKETRISSFNFQNILSIGESAFESAAQLAQDINLGSTINVTIGNKAFYKSGITGLTLGEKVIKLGDEAFSETDIVSADLSGLNITAISDSFFANCANLTTVTINDKIRTIGASAFTGTAIIDLDFLAVATELEQIMDSAFEACESLTEATIPSTVSYVGAAAFKGCITLADVTWSTCANVINDETFNGCDMLTYFNVPENVSRIGKFVFSPSIAEGAPLAILKFNSVNPPSINEDFTSAFDYIKIQVPTGSLTNYMKNYVFAKVVINIEEV